MYFDRKCKITFISHGATIYSEENRFSDKDNYPPLNENGVEEVEKICQFLKLRGVKNDRIYTSSAARCVQTAKYVSKIYKKLFEENTIKDFYDLSNPSSGNPSSGSFSSQFK